MSERPGRGDGRNAAAGRGARGSERSFRSRSAQRPAQRARTGDPARLVAYQVLRATAEGAYANLELPRALRQARLHGRDAAFATELTFGTLRMHGLYDPILARAAGRALREIDPPVLDTLRLGAHQLLGMRVPAHAAVDQTVALARGVNGSGPAGFVNAVLRRVGEKDRSAWVAEVVAGLQPLEATSVEYSHPPWAVRALRAALVGRRASRAQGGHTDETDETAETIDADLVRLLQVDNTAPPVTLVARPGLCTVQELIVQGAQPADLSPLGAVLDGGDPGALAQVRDGRAAVQDQGSQLVALALAAAPLTGPDERWLDLAAGPGGKAAVLAALARQRSARLVAVEISPHRADLVHATLAAIVAAGAEVEVRVQDGRQLGDAEPEAYDRVLLDAPCTGLGAIRRRAESRWRRTPADLAGLGALQRALLTAALDATRTGGVVGYATCSPHLAETTFVVRDVLRRRNDVEAEDARPLFRDAAGRQIESLGDGPYVQLWPHLHGTDGMFFALLRKV